VKRGEAKESDGRETSNRKVKQQNYRLVTLLERRGWSRKKNSSKRSAMKTEERKTKNVAVGKKGGRT